MSLHVDVTVSVVTFNNAATIAACIDSIRIAAGDRSVQIIVVDNASSDGTVSVVSAREGVELISSEVNLGFGAAHNRAFDVARGRYFVCLNPDAFLNPDALAHFVEVLDAEPEVGLAGGRIYRPDGTPRANCARIVDGLEFALRNCIPTPSRIIAAFPPEVWECAQQQYVPAVVGACFVFRSTAFAAIGGFDEALFMYHEGPDVALRMRAAGWRVLVVPEAGIVHLGNGSRQSQAAIRSRMRSSSRIYAHKHLSPLDAYVAVALLRVSSILKLDDALDLYLRGRRTLAKRRSV